MSIYTITTQPIKLVIMSLNMVTENVHPSSCTIGMTARVASPDLQASGHEENPFHFHNLL